MSTTSKIGVEAEFILRDNKGKVIIPPAYLDRDGFPVLGEIRGAPGKDMEETVINFMKAKMHTERSLRANHILSFELVTMVPLSTYKEAMKIIRDSDEEKDALLSSIMNIYNTDISDYSDQVIKNNKIQGCRASCGLHIHFSSEERDKRTYTKEEFEKIELPLTIVDGKVKTAIHLHKSTGDKEVETIEVAVSQLNKPTIEWIVKRMDDEFFERFVSSKADKTKFRQPGFFELKDYGFEYRSLPATPESLDALVEIVSFASDMLKDLNKFDYRSV